MDEPVAPIVNALNAPFWSAAAEARLALPCCVASGRPFWPPSPVSPFVTGGDVVWRDQNPAGVLRARAIYRRVFQKAFEALTPYAIGLVELDAGPRLQVHIPMPDGVPAADQGERVVICFEAVTPQGPRIPVARRGGER